VPVVIRQVSGQDGNPFGHVTEQVGNAREVGFGPKSGHTMEVLENKTVPGQMEGRAPGTTTERSVTIWATPKEANAAIKVINGMIANPGGYKLDGRSCVDMGAGVVRALGINPPSATLPGTFLQGLIDQQSRTGSDQAP